MNKKILAIITLIFASLISLVFLYLQDEEPSELYLEFTKVKPVSDEEWNNFKAMASFFAFGEVDVKRYEEYLKPGGVISDSPFEEVESVCKPFRSNAEQPFFECLEHLWKDGYFAIDISESAVKQLETYHQLNQLEGLKIPYSLIQDNPRYAFEPVEWLKFSNIYELYGIWLTNQVLQGKQNECALIEAIERSSEMLTETNGLLLSVTKLIEVGRFIDILEFLAKKDFIFDCARLMNVSQPFSFESSLYFERFTSLVGGTYLYYEKLSRDIHLKPQKILNQTAESFINFGGKKIDSQLSKLRNWNNYKGYILLNVARPNYINIKHDVATTHSRVLLASYFLRYQLCENGNQSGCNEKLQQSTHPETEEKVSVDWEHRILYFKKSPEKVTFSF